MRSKILYGALSSLSMIFCNESVHPKSPRSTPPPSDIFLFYTIHRYIKARKILKISGQNTYGNYIFYVFGDCHFCPFGFLKIPFSNIEFSFKLPKFEKYPSKLPTNTYLYRLLSKDSKNLLKTLKNTGIMLLMTPEPSISRK